MAMLIPIRDRNPYKRFPVVTVALIAINVWVFLTVGISDIAAFKYGAVPCDVLGRCPTAPPAVDQLLQSRPPLWSVVTSMFMHGGILHIAGNMLYLWVFGNNVEDALGRVRFAIFYFATGFAAAFAFILINPDSTVPLVGASGAISGILGGYLLLFPRARVLSLVPILFFFTTVETPAWVVLGLWFVLQLFSATAEQETQIAFLAHVAGFVAGLALVYPLGGRRQRRPDPLDQFR